MLLVVRLGVTQSNANFVDSCGLAGSVTHGRTQLRWKVSTATLLHTGIFVNQRRAGFDVGEYADMLEIT